MQIAQKIWSPSKGWKEESTLSLDRAPEVKLVLVFGERALLNRPGIIEELKSFYPQAHVVLASTSGNIIGTSVIDQALVATAIAFQNPTSRVEVRSINIHNEPSSAAAGKQLGSSFIHEDLNHILILSDGQLVNGSELTHGLIEALPSHVSVTGGLAGDGKLFEKTLVGIDQIPQEGEIAAIGFYGSSLQFGFGSVGGWDPFGVERKITRSQGNILYQLDNKPALDLYKSYLSDLAKDLPGSALLFPLAIRQDENSPPLVRTILKINEKDQSMIFAGDIPEGWFAQLMKANFDRLVEGAGFAASASYEMLDKKSPGLAILISCVGRKLVLDQRVEDELESVQDIIGKGVPLTGFYSYGEISPTAPHANCELHNQTMTITTILERL